MGTAWPEVVVGVAAAAVMQLASVSTLASPPGAPVNVGAKVGFDLDMLDGDGLYGQPDSLRALDYEFCIPAHERYAAEVRAIDPTVQIFSSSPGRVACTENEYLAIGNTHQSGFRSVLFELASLPYVRRIEPAYFE